MTDTQSVIARVLQDIKESMPRCPMFKHVTVESPAKKYGIIFDGKKSKKKKKKTQK